MARKPKPASRKSSLKRQINQRPLRQRFLIVCEGEKTEPNYFRSFRVPKDVIDIIGIGDNTIGIVRDAINRMQQAGYDQIWCVFDRDSFPVENFNNALNLAHERDIKVAYSNEAFELWYLLHYDFHDTAIPRQTYKTRLSQRLGFEYVKNSHDMYELLEDKQPIAIRNASRLLDEYGEQHRPAYDNPCTTVHLLVQELNKVAV
jgi:hypothetical protein